MYIPRIPCAWMAAALWAVASSAAHAQWTIDYTVRYEAAGQQTGKPGERRGPDTLVSEKITWRVQQEVRGTLNYTQKVRGAVASNMPDKNNEQRYDSWISRSGRAGNPASLKLDSEEVMDSAVRLGKADGEGAGELNRERAGKFGRVEHLRTRITLAGEGPGAAKLNDPFLQIDRVDGKLHFEPPAIDFDPAQVRFVVRKGDAHGQARRRWRVGQQRRQGAAHHGAAEPAAAAGAGVRHAAGRAVVRGHAHRRRARAHRRQGDDHDRAASCRRGAAASAALDLSASATTPTAARRPRPPQPHPPRPRETQLPAGSRPTVQRPVLRRARRSAARRWVAATDDRWARRSAVFLGASAAPRNETSPLQQIARADSSRRATYANARTTYAMGTSTRCRCCARRGGADQHAMAGKTDGGASTTRR